MRITLLLLSLLIVEVYFIQRVNSAAKNSGVKKKIRKTAIIAYLIVLNITVVLSIIFFFLRFAGVDIHEPDNWLYIALVKFPFWLFFLYTLQTALYLLVIDIFRIIFLLFRSVKEKAYRFLDYAVLIVVLFFIVYLPVRIIYDYNAVNSHYYEAYIDDLPEDLDGFRIALTGDVQADRYTGRSRLSNYLSKINNENADLILIAGDVVTGSDKYIELAAEMLGKLRAPYGVWSTVGDHDQWVYRRDHAKSLDTVRTALKKHGVPMLDNANMVFKVGNTEILTTFVTETYSRRLSNGVVDSLAKGAGDAGASIFLVHQPSERLIYDAYRKGYDIIMSGHTHGGQIGLIFPFYRFTPTMFETKYIAGKYMYKDMSIFVTRGLGVSIAPLRFNSTPGYSVITLKKKMK